MNAKQILTTLITALTLALVLSPVQAFDTIPEQVTLDSMVKYFEAVEFDHAMHTELGEDCSACHHHTTGTGTTDERCLRCHMDSDEAATVSCSGCHLAEPFSADQINQAAADIYKLHNDRTGLKAAYHWNCIDCHQKMDGPTDCQDCHARTSEGDAFYHADAEPSTSAGSSH